MDINTAISAEDLSNLTRRVEAFNRSLNPARAVQNEMGKDDFLKLLITQLSHQDPTQPMQDREFVAQMAQFSTLEQMTNMNGELSKVLGLLARSQAVNLLGKTVELSAGEGRITGQVEAISGNEFPQVLVAGRYYDVSEVLSVRGIEEVEAPMMRSLWAGVAGLQNHQVRMDVLGNNIANVNTTGFKKGRVNFQDMLSQTLAGAARPTDEVGGVNPKQVGLGMVIATIDTIHTQGSLQTTGVMTDLALQGEGFFIQQDGEKKLLHPQRRLRPGRERHPGEPGQRHAGAGLAGADAWAG